MSALDVFITYFQTWFGDGQYVDFVVLLAILFVSFFFFHIIVYPLMSLVKGKTYYKILAVTLAVSFTFLSFSKLVLPYIPVSSDDDVVDYRWSTFRDLQRLVREGHASEVLSVGDQINVKYNNSILVWDVLGIDCDTPADTRYTHSVTLGLHDCLAALQFDAREALFYFPDGLAAGTYNFKVTQHSWVSSDVNKTFQFTLTQAVPAGGQIVLQVSYNVTIAGSTLVTYASASATTEIETVTITEGSSGISLGDVNNAISGNTNSLQRGFLGNNRYSVSAIRQYLNSSASAGSVWIPKHNFDRAPSWSTSTAGFLNGMDEDFLSVIGEVTKVTALNTVSDGGGSETTTERFFLLSRSEVYGGNEVTGGEGAAYPYYANYSDLAAPGMENDTNRIKYRNGSAQYWWLRSPNVSGASHVFRVYPSGNVSESYAYNAYVFSPACCIV